MVEQLAVGKAAADLVQDQDFLAALFDGLEIEVQRLIFGLPFDAFQPVQLGLAPAGLLGLDAGFVFADIFFRFVDVFLLLLLGLFQGLLLLGMLLDIARIIALVFSYLAVGQFEDARRHAVEEITVMGYDEDAAAIRQEIAFQPFQHVHVEMVRRFIEEQIIRPADEGLGQIDARLLAARKALDRPVHVGFRKAQALDDFPRHRFVFIAAEPLEPFLHAGIAVHQAFIIGMGLHGLFDSLQILFQLHDVLPGLGNRLAQGHIVGVGDILLQIADGFTFRNDKGPVVVVLFAHEALEQRRLPGPVGPDEADPFAPADFKTHIMEYRMHSKRLTQFLYFNTTHLYNPALPGILTTKQKKSRPRLLS